MKEVGLQKKGKDKLKTLSKNNISYVAFVAIIILGVIFWYAADSRQDPASENVYNDTVEELSEVEIEDQDFVDLRGVALKQDQGLLESLIDQAGQADGDQVRRGLGYAESALLAERIGDSRAEELSATALQILETEDQLDDDPTLQRIITLLRGIIAGDYSQDELDELAPGTSFTDVEGEQ